MTKSGESAEPSSARRTVDWKVKSKSSMVFRNGKLRALRERAMRVCWRWATLLGDQEREEVAIGPLLGLGARDELGLDAPGVGQVQTLEHAVEIESAGFISAQLLLATALGGGGGCSDSAVRDVLGAEQALGEAALEGRAQRVGAVAAASSACS